MKKILMLLVIISLCSIHVFSKEKLKIENKVKYSNQGTKSEARHWSLFINGINIPDVFNKVYCQDQLFIFAQRAAMWGDDGYFKSQEKLIIAESKKTISNEDLKKGWYIGKEKLINTPDTWIYAEWEDKAVFIDYKKINDLINELKLKTMPRQKTDIDSLK